MCGKDFSIYGAYIPRKCIDSMHFYTWPSSPAQNPRQGILRTCFLQDKKSGENYDFLYQNSIKRHEDDLEH